MVTGESLVSVMRMREVAPIRKNRGMRPRQIANLLVRLGSLACIGMMDGAA